MCENFQKICKKCSINLIGRDSGGIWLKKLRLGDIRAQGDIVYTYTSRTLLIWLEKVRKLRRQK